MTALDLAFTKDLQCGPLRSHCACGFLSRQSFIKQIETAFGTETK